MNWHLPLTIDRRKVYKGVILYNIMGKIIMKVWRNKTINQKLITIPKECNIKEGDYVEIRKIK